MKWFLTVLLLLFASVANAQLTAKHWDATCRIDVAGSAGSGILVRDEGQCYVLTAAHVIRGSEYANVTFRNGKRVSAREMYVDKNGSDSGLIVIDDPGIEPVEIADATPVSGTEVLALGYGGQGKLVGLHNTLLQDRGNSIRLFGGLRPGDSGGPVFDPSGRVIGLNSSVEVRNKVPTGYCNVCCWRPFKDMITRMRERIRDRSQARAGRMQERLDEDTQCPGGQCPPPRYSQPRPAPTPRQQLPPGFSEAPPPEIRPAPGQPGPIESEPSQPATIDYEKLASLVASKIPKPKDGATGPAGPQGPQGERGPSGKDGKDADLAALDDKLKQLGFWVQTLDHAGKPFGEKQFVRLGQTLDIKPLAVPAPK